MFIFCTNWRRRRKIPLRSSHTVQSEQYVLSWSAVWLVFYRLGNKLTELVVSPPISELQPERRNPWQRRSGFSGPLWADQWTSVKQLEQRDHPNNMAARCAVRKVPSRKGASYLIRLCYYQHSPLRGGSNRTSLWCLCEKSQPARRNRRDISSCCVTSRGLFLTV